MRGLQVQVGRPELFDFEIAKDRFVPVLRHFLKSSGYGKPTVVTGSDNEIFINLVAPKEHRIAIAVRCYASRPIEIVPPSSHYSLEEMQHYLKTLQDANTIANLFAAQLEAVK